MLIDEITLHLKAGDGGNGIVAWLHEKGKEFMGPAGGDGGKGGDVYLTAVRDIGRLASYRYGNLFGAGRGGHGQGKSRHGKGGTDILLEIPVGSVVANMSTGRTYEFLTAGERTRVLRGGTGGFGNEHFKGSRNVRPMQSTVGKKGEAADFHVELRLIADAGLIGLPNAGKSSLLNALTAAHAKVGSYAFTTLEPNLGVIPLTKGGPPARLERLGRSSRAGTESARRGLPSGFILADIPGLIEGASSGRGLGVKFLRHIRRTRILIHCISLENDDPLTVYGVVRRELDSYATELSEKEEMIALTKADAVSKEALVRAVSEMKKTGRLVLAVSVLDDRRLRIFKKALLGLLPANL